MKHITNEPLLRKPSSIEFSSPDSVRIHQVVLNADLRYMLPGLISLCDKMKIKLEEKQKGNLVVFINSARNLIKVIVCNKTSNPVLAVYRLTSGRIYDLSVVQEIPKAMNMSGHVNFDLALKLALEKKFGRKEEPETE